MAEMARVGTTSLLPLQQGSTRPLHTRSPLEALELRLSARLKMLLFARTRPVRVARLLLTIRAQVWYRWVTSKYGFAPQDLSDLGKSKRQRVTVASAYLIHEINSLHRPAKAPASTNLSSVCWLIPLRMSVCLRSEPVVRRSRIAVPFRLFRGRTALLLSEWSGGITTMPQ